MTSKPETAIFVLGGTGGLGAAICTHFAAAGRPVFFTYRTRDAEATVLKDALGEAYAGHCRVDAEDATQVVAALQQAGDSARIGAVVGASGPAIPQKYFSAATHEDWRVYVQAELTSFFNLAHAALPLLRAEKGALIALTSCATARVIPGDVLSAAPKAAIEAVVRQIAREEGRYGVRANCVAPGIIDAGLGQHAQQSFYTPEVWDQQRRNLPLRAFGSADAIAEAVVYLASDAAAYVTGQTLVVDGGYTT